MYKISVVVPTIRMDLIPQLKMHLDRQTQAVYELVVVEDKERKGNSWSRNRGIKRAKGDWIALIDDDCLPAEDWLETMIQSCLKFNAEAGAGVYEETDTLLRDLRQKKDYPKEAGIDEDDVVAVGGNVIFSRKLLDECLKKYGYIYNEKMRYSQDHELSWRLRNMGYQIVYVPSRPVHLKKVNFISYMKYCYNRGRGIAMLARAIKVNKIKPHQKSLMWNKSGKTKAGGWIRAAAQLGIGPFDRSNFSSNRNFIYYWLGEKMKALGYIFEYARQMKRSFFIKN